MSLHSVAKLAVPRAVEILRRPRVIKLIDRALKAGMCWIAAPAGYGKTTAVADYLRSTRSAHVWFRIDEGDQDIARFFQYLSQSLDTVEAAADMPVFGVEYAERPREFARIFFRAYFARLRSGTTLVLDDLHYADTPEFRGVLSVMLRELPDTLSCVCLSRSLPQDELAEIALAGQMSLMERSALEFSDSEARSLVRLRLSQAADRVDVGAARGWALGLVLMAENRPAAGAFGGEGAGEGRGAMFDVLGRHFFDAFPPPDQEMLLKLNLLPEISTELADAMVGSNEAGRLLERLYSRQLLITRAESGGSYFQLHDLFREFLDLRFGQRFSGAEQAGLREHAAKVLRATGRLDDAVAVALQGGAWALARELIVEQADAVLAAGRRATVVEWCSRLPPEQMDAWLSYWLGVAHVPDDAAAEHWLSRAWDLFEQVGDRRGQALTASRAILVKTDSWRTYEGLSAWTRRAMSLLEAGLPDLGGTEDLLVRIGMLRALTFADDYYRDSPAGRQLRDELLDRLSRPRAGDPAGLRLLASESLMELAAVTMQQGLFEKAIDSVVDDLRNPDAPPWDLGMWLVTFGAKNGRYFHYARRAFPYATSEDALRAAVAIGERESLINVEFGALYHLQLQMKFRNDFGEFARLVGRLAEIADSRFTTQVAVVADCQAALHARQGDFAEAHRDCERFMAAIEAANEPMLERWPHYVTQFQVLLADRKPEEAIALLAGILPRLDGGAHKRTELCILAAEALAARWSGDPGYGERLTRFIGELRDAKWPMILLNLPERLAELIADALERDIAAEFCRSIIAERRLLPPAHRPGGWPWPLKVHVLGGFRLERNGEPVELGAKPPTRALDILRALAISKDCACSMETLLDWLWPDLDGDQAKAACEQALHRLRKLLGQADLVVQREGKLRLAVEHVWVDFTEWERRLGTASSRNGGTEADVAQLEQLFFDFPGPLLLNERLAFWALPATERVRSQIVDLAGRIGKQRERVDEAEGARAIYLRTLDFYPDSAAIHRRLIEARLAEGDTAGAMSDYARYEQTIRAVDGEPSPTVLSLVRPLLADESRQAGRLKER